MAQKDAPVRTSPRPCAKMETEKEMIKNYTSSVPPERSVNHIEKTLVAHGAKNIMKTYTPEAKLGGLFFVISIEGTDRPFKVPARVDRVEKRLKEQVKKPHRGTMERISEQAERTAWKLLADWVDIQMSLIDLDQAEFLEVFLPYVQTGREQTFFEKIKKDSMRLLNQ
jgi:hypothetical protein